MYGKYVAIGNVTIVSYSTYWQLQDADIYFPGELSSLAESMVNFFFDRVKKGIR